VLGALGDGEELGLGVLLGVGKNVNCVHCVAGENSDANDST
jgi:hypothetical protein